jgi:DNA-binding NarL/FixJ family response regulator
MSTASATSVLLADRHHGLYQGIRGLLETTFGKVFLVTDKPSLMEGAVRLEPSVIVMDLSFAAGDLPALLTELRRDAPAAKLLLLSVHDEPTIIASAIAAGADGLIVKRAIASDLLHAIDEVLAGRRYFHSSSNN